MWLLQQVYGSQSGRHAADGHVKHSSSTVAPELLPLLHRLQISFQPLSQDHQADCLSHLQVRKFLNCCDPIVHATALLFTVLIIPGGRVAGRQSQRALLPLCLALCPEIPGHLVKRITPACVAVPITKRGYSWQA